MLQAGWESRENHRETSWVCHVMELTVYPTQGQFGSLHFVMLKSEPPIHVGSGEREVASCSSSLFVCVGMCPRRQGC